MNESKVSQARLSRREAIGLAGAVALAVPHVFAAPPPFTLPPLPYAADALEPYIDAQTMTIHHDKHHQAYVDNLNKAVASTPTLSGMSLEELLTKLDTVPEAVRTAVRNNAGGDANHTLLWLTLAPAKGQQPKGKLAAALDSSFGSYSKFEDQLKAAATGVFGSGWAWLVVDPSKKLAIEAYPNQDAPITKGRKPLLGIDVWEHAYYLKHQNRRPEYLAAIVKVINWDFVSQRYEEVTR
jgi:Fe-Mn family superoxide dismutase